MTRDPASHAPTHTSTGRHRSELFGQVGVLRLPRRDLCARREPELHQDALDRGLSGSHRDHRPIGQA